ncbi:MAG: PH domain-containing protein [Oscillospiraceae bacterium]|nr:PH domain-containing protein [Oscillospiraceae bacterium]
MIPAVSRGRSHPMTIFFSLGRVLYLIVIPVLRGAVTALRGGLYAWSSGAWADTLVLLFMLAFAVISWRRCTYEYDALCLTVRRGVFRSRCVTVPWKQISALSKTSPFLLRPFRAAILRADTIAARSSNGRHDIDICIHENTALQILEFRRNSYIHSGKSRMAREYSPGMRSIAAYAFLNSNTFAGIVFLSTFISQTGRLLGDEFSGRLIGSFERLSRSSTMGAIGLPPAAAAISLALLLGWLIAFTLTIIRYHGFKVRDRAGILSVYGGFFTRRQYVVDKNLVNFVDIRQTAASMLLGLCSLYICTPGYAVRKDDIACLIPTRRGRSVDFMRELFHDYTPKPPAPHLKPSPRGKPGYILPALCPCIGIPALAVFVLIYFPLSQNYRDLTMFVMIMLLAPSLLFLLVRWIDFRTGGISLDGSGCTLRYSRGFKLHTVAIPGDKIAMAVIRRSIFQRFRGRCNLIIYSISTKRKTHICRNMVHGEVVRLPILPILEIGY